MEFTSFSTESCAPAGDGGIVPGLVPIPNVDPDALEEAVGRLRAVGEAIEESGEGITSTWASLTGVYVAPEADTLLSVLDPVSSDGSAVATGIRDAASALETFAETARELKSRLTGLKAEAEAFRADVGWDREWLEDEDERERNNDLNNRVAAAVHEYQEAERACANAIGQHYGGTFFTGHSDKAGHDQTSTGGDRTWQVYGTASAPGDQANPWGSAVDEPPGALENVFWSVGDIAIGMAVGLGVTTGLYRDGQFVYPFGTEHGQNLLTNWEEAKNSFWALAGSDGQGEWIAPDSLDAQYHNAKEAWQAYGDAIVPVSEWDHRPEYTIVNGAGNIALMASPLGWSRVFLDGPDPGSGSGPDGDGSSGGGNSANGANGTNGAGNGLRGTDTVGMATTSPTGSQPDPGSAVGGMHEALAALESQPNEAPSTGDTSAGSEADAPRDADGPTARELHDGTADSGADTSSAPWAAAPVNDGSAPSAESPTTPVGDVPSDAHSDGDPHASRESDGTAATDAGNGREGGDNDGSGPPLGDIGPDEGAPDSGGSGDEGSLLEEDEGSLLVPGVSPEPDASTPLQDRPLDSTSDDPAVKELVPQGGKLFGEGVTLEPNTRYTLLEADGQRSTEYITDGEGAIREIRADSEGWSAKHPEFLNPRPDMTYVVDGRYTFRTDGFGRTVSAEGTLTREENERNGPRQDAVGDAGENYFRHLNEQIRQDFLTTEGRAPEPGEVPQYDEIEYQGGHLIGSQFFGIGENLNMTPMRYDINQNRTLTAFHDRAAEDLGGIRGSFYNVERTWRGIFRQGTDWHGFTDPRFNDGSWESAYALNPGNPKIDVKITNEYDPNMPSVEGPKGTIYPPPRKIIVHWSLNGVAMRPLEYPNLPPLA
ncbi:DNA/RNA non-specific endonuclease [Nocardiopsis dassonvillei]|uniref:DNA/RNA non-specific endonuclease n=1 Tax=Nocardiopsis dassonvillei TaxID=2014 RepID=UPI0020A5D1B8|nr:DNA/RNA non-specific endonuclease [Nocardiopsis dassonvillei]MCP3013074.1 DNA/RNA non-specific endonuclease [Nocardiopsis dassonvillei]